MRQGKSSSFPSRERGLKLIVFSFREVVNRVVPLAGTWIETCLAMSNPNEHPSSFPSRERGLKLADFNKSRKVNIGRSPRGNVD